MIEDIFSSGEIKWLQAHPKIKEHIDESLEDSLSVNSLDSGEPDLIPYQRAVKATHITIEVAEKKLIAGPYDSVHWQIICKHLCTYPFLVNKEKTFLQIFSFQCACSREEDETRPNERIYMEAMKEMIRIIEEETIEYMGDDNNQVADLNSGTIQQIKGKGVNARFTD